MMLDVGVDGISVIRADGTFNPASTIEETLDEELISVVWKELEELAAIM